MDKDTKDYTKPKMIVLGTSKGNIKIKLFGSDLYHKVLRWDYSHARGRYRPMQVSWIDAIERLTKPVLDAWNTPPYYFRIVSQDDLHELIIYITMLGGEFFRKMQRQGNLNNDSWDAIKEFKRI